MCCCTHSEFPSQFCSSAVRQGILLGTLSLLFVFMSGTLPLAAASGRQPQSGEPTATEAEESRAKQLALAAHAQASAIDHLPRFFITADAATQTNLKIDGFAVEEAATDFEQHIVFWGRPDLAGQYALPNAKPAQHVLRSSAAEMWKGRSLSNPNYLLTTSHKFWWGDNSEHSQGFWSWVAPEQVRYRMLPSEKFDGVECHVVESPRRRERLWIGKKSGRIQGYLQGRFNFSEATEQFRTSEAMRRIAGRTFDDRREYVHWYQAEDTTEQQKEELETALATMMMEQPTQPRLLVRFRDFREISPGIWWPFVEDRVNRRGTAKSGENIRSTYRVKQIRTDVDLTERVLSMQPKEGEQVQDQRYGIAVNYKYREDRSEDDILELVDAARQQRQADKALMETLKKPYETLIGKPAPTLPETGWIGELPNLGGKPYLIQFWAVWCGPCKADMPILKRLAEDGATLVGIHPAGTQTGKVEATLAEAEIKFPTWLAAKREGRGPRARISGYPATIFPYYVLVDAEGLVRAHGSLRENGGALLHQFRKLRER